MDAADRELESLLVATLHPLSDFLYAVILNKPSSVFFFTIYLHWPFILILIPLMNYNVTPLRKAFLFPTQLEIRWTIFYFTGCLTNQIQLNSLISSLMQSKNIRKINISKFQKTIVDFQTFTTYSKDNFFLNFLALVQL